MPYIKKSERGKFLHTIYCMLDNIKEIHNFGKPSSHIHYRLTGNLNYFLFKLCKEWIKLNGESYANYQDFIGELEAAKLEIHRRQIAPYEDKKIEENGDVE